MIEVAEARLGLIEEERRSLLKTFIDEITSFPFAQGIFSVELEAFKPTGLKVKSNVLLVNTVMPSANGLVREVYDQVADRDEVKERLLGSLVCFAGRQSEHLWDLIGTYANGAARTTITPLWLKADR